MELEKKMDGKIIIHLENYGYLMFEPLAKINDDQNYSITLKVNDAMSISREALSVVDDPQKLMKCSIIVAIDSLNKTLKNIQKEIKND